MQHIILIGFKHVGKTQVGMRLAAELGRPFLDTDREVERLFGGSTGMAKSCRQIMHEQGEVRFRALEHEALAGALDAQGSRVISVGGGVPLQKENQDLLVGNVVVQVTSPKGMVYERIMVGGRPAFFPPEQNAHEVFQRLWDERAPVYEELATLVINNNGTIEEAVDELKGLLSGITPVIPTTKEESLSHQCIQLDRDPSSARASLGMTGVI